MIKLPPRDMPNQEANADEGVNAGFTKEVYWRDLFDAEFDINNPKKSIGRKECIQAKLDLDIHVSGIYTTHGDPYTDTVFTLMNDNVVFFEVCKPILEKEEKSELKLEHSDMESYLRDVHGYETYHSFLDMKYMSKCCMLLSMYSNLVRQYLTYHDILYTRERERGLPSLIDSGSLCILACLRIISYVGKRSPSTILPVRIGYTIQESL